MLGNNLCVSVSLDQRLILWNQQDTRLSCLSTICCDVSDIQGLDVFPGATKTLVVVYGQGVQVFEVDNSLSVTQNVEYPSAKIVDPLSA